jgi:hypothetical protein
MPKKQNKRKPFLVAMEGASGTNEPFSANKFNIEQMIEKHNEIKDLKEKVDAYEKILLDIFEGMNSDVEWRMYAIIHKALTKYCPKKIRY